MKRLSIVLSILMVLSLLLSACGAAAPTSTEEAAATELPAQPAATDAPAATEAAPLEPGDPLPRTETLYFNGQQWGPVIGWNPYSTNNNNAMAIAQQDNARVTMFETPYMYNMLDGRVYPLLADGAFCLERRSDRDHLQTQSSRALERWHPGHR